MRLMEYAGVPGMEKKAPRPFAEQVIAGYLELVSLTHNNPRRYRFIDRPEYSESIEV